jgi:hypothetical protein
MKLLFAARFSGLAFVVAGLYTFFLMGPGLRLASGVDLRQAWVLDNVRLWHLGWWLWLIAIFSWMVVLIGLHWSYLPAHRVEGMLQSGLMVIGAVLSIAGILVWMAVLPVIFAQGDPAEILTPLADALALGLLSAGLMMSGGATAWIALDLLRQKVLSRGWLVFPLVAGLSAFASPLLVPSPYHLFVALACWVAWCGWLATRPRLPSPFVEWPVARLNQE